MSSNFNQIKYKIKYFDVSEKDVGDTVTSNLKPSVQCANAAKKDNMVLGQITRGVTFRDRTTFIRLYQVFVLPHLSYAVQAWAPFNKADKELLEKVQRRAVMMVTNIRGSYEERLAILKMRTLEAQWGMFAWHVKARRM